MSQSNKWREAITGEPFEMSVVNEMMNQLDLLQELWQYIEITTHQIKDWKNQLVKKVSWCKNRILLTIFELMLFWIDIMQRGEASLQTKSVLTS